MTGAPGDRRQFLQWAAGAALGATALPPGVAEALALPANRATGTLRDVEHVVILMQENRGFDHYFGTMRGVRGFGDPRPIALPSGQPVWKQPAKDGVSTVSPFHLDTASTRAESIFSLDHSWKGSHARWMRHDAWVPAKGALTMGYFTRGDIPFYYALADAFTVCDAYHCSIFSQTTPNRLFLFTGTSGLAAGDDSKIVIANPPEETNETADPAHDGPGFKGLTWPTYAERLQAAGVSWRIYQEYDNYGDNGLAYFANFRGVGPESPLYQRGRAWVPGASAANAKTSQGEHLVAAFAADVAADRLPQVSWIVPSYHLCEHPTATPSDGAFLTARLIAALAANPKVWAKTVFILNYDENDGFFDHVPPPIPPVGTAAGKSTVATTYEDYHGEPVGLGPRVPMIVVSPWTKGGFVNSELFFPHLGDPLPGGAFRGDGAADQPLAPRGLRRPHQRLRFQDPERPGPGPAGRLGPAGPRRQGQGPAAPQAAGLARAPAAPGARPAARARLALPGRGRRSLRRRRLRPRHRKQRPGRRGVRPVPGGPWRTAVLHGGRRPPARGPDPGRGRRL